MKGAFYLVTLLTLHDHFWSRATVQGIWHCETPQENSEYQCDPKSVTTLFLGVFVNRGTDNVTKPLGKAQIGVEVLKPHNVNYGALNASLPDEWRDIFMAPRYYAEFEPHEVTSASITLSPGDIAPVFQKRTTCGYKSDKRTVNDALAVYSRQYEPYRGRRYNANADMCWYRSSDRETIVARFDDDEVQIIINTRSTERYVIVSYEEGGILNMDPDTREDKGEGDDRVEYVKLMNSKIAGLGPVPSVKSGGLDWAKKYKPFQEFELQKKQANFSAPPNRATKFYQARASCDEYVYVKSWVFPVYFPLPILNQGRGQRGECESPDIQPFCVYSRWDVMTPEFSIHSERCSAAFEEVPIPEDETSVTVEYGVRGPFADRLGVDFKNQFLERLREIGVYTSYNWANLDVPNWDAYEGKNKSLEVPKPANRSVLVDVFQMQGACGLYTLDTQYVVFVHSGWDKSKDCMKIEGNVPPGLTCELMMNRPFRW